MNTTTKWVLIAITAAIVAFAVGALWQWTAARAARAELEEVRAELIQARLEATLGAAAIEAQRGSYEIARQLASEFFNELQGGIDGVSPQSRDVLRGILDRRDATITMLSRADAESGAVLSRMFVQLRTALRGADAGAPISTPAPVPEPT